MTYYQFLELMEKRVNQFLMEGIETSIQQTTKNNGVNKSGLLFHEEGNCVCPTIYLDDFFEEHEKELECCKDNILFYENKLSRLAFEIIDLYHSVKGRFAEEAELLFDYEYLKENVTYRLVNYERNKELLKEMPYERYMDLALVYVVIFDGFSNDNNEEQVGVLYIKNEHIDNWGVMKEDLAKVALDNTIRMFPWRLSSLSSIAGCQDGQSINKVGEDLYVLTNECCLHGATVILYPQMLQKIAEIVESDFYILPSSVHEVLICPICADEMIDKEFLEGMVQEVNQTAVDPEEILSEKVYLYRKETGIVTY